MAKIVLGKRPVSFSKIVKVQMLEGGEGDLPVVFKYRTLTEFGTFLDDYTKQAEEKLDALRAEREAQRSEAEEKGETYVDPVMTNEEARKIQAKANADYLMEIMLGWGLDVEFSADAVLQMCDELPGAASEITTAYRLAITEGRLGN